MYRVKFTTAVFGKTAHYNQSDNNNVWVTSIDHTNGDQRQTE